MSDILTGHVLDRLAEMGAESVSCCVTSPPYWSLRRYDAEEVVWGGVEGCEHEWGEAGVALVGRNDEGEADLARRAALYNTGQRKASLEANPREATTGATCARCGAWRGQYGLEPTPELYVEHTLDVLRGIRRVLRDDGVVWWNIGDGYASGGSGSVGSSASSTLTTASREGAWAPGKTIQTVKRDGGVPPGLKPKDLVLMPFRIALAAQADGWWVRSVVIWAKPNAMPESVTDRPTGAHEYVLMLTQSAKYWYDADAVREGYSAASLADKRDNENGHRRDRGDPLGVDNGGTNLGGNRHAGRNMRSVWTFPTAQTPEKHFAVYPPELPRRCIAASCPKYFCPACGTPGPITRTSRADVRERYWRRWHQGKTEYGGTVLDPFAGVGTTGYVALQLGRRFVGIELSEKYAAIARTKLQTWWRPGKITEPEVPEGQAALL